MISTGECRPTLSTTPGPNPRTTIQTERIQAERGVALITAALLIPLMLAIAVVVFDLARLYLNAIYAQEVALLTAKIATSGSPDGYAIPQGNIAELSFAPAGEEESIATRRASFWADQISPESSRYHGKTYFTEKERKVFNLGYGFAHTLSPKTYFPAPEPMINASAWSDLHFRANCSLYFRFAAGSEPPSTLPSEGDANYDSVMDLNRDRIYYVDCVVPVIGLSMLGFGSGDAYRVVSKNAYAYHSGTIRP